MNKKHTTYIFYGGCSIAALAIMIVVGLYHWKAIDLYWETIIRNKSVVLTIQNSYHDTAKHLKRTIYNYLSSYRGSKDPVPALYLDIAPEEERKLNTDLPDSGFQFVKAKLVTGNIIHRVKVRYRGDTSTNWMTNEPAYHIKTQEVESLWEGSAEIDMIRKKNLLSDLLLMQLAGRLGLLAQTTWEARLYKNGKYQGYVNIGLPIGSTLLEQQERTVGDIYQGENGTRDIYPGVTTNVFEVPSIWKYKAKNEIMNTQKQDLFLLLASLQSALNGGMLQPFLQLIDQKDAIYFSAWVTLAQSFHYDFFHNTILYFDPTKGVFSQIAKDPAAGAFIESQKRGPIDIVTNDFLMTLHKDPRFVFEKYQLLWKLFEKENIIDWLEGTYQHIEQKRSKAGTRAFVENGFGETKKLMTQYFQALRDIAQKISETDVAYSISQKNKNTILTLRVSGQSAVSWEGEVVGEIYRDNNMNGQFDREDTPANFPEMLYPGRKIDWEIEDRPFLVPEPLVYQYIVINAPEQITPKLSNGLTGKSVSTQYVDAITVTKLLYPAYYPTYMRQRHSISVHPWLLERETVKASDYPQFHNDLWNFKYLVQKAESRSKFLKRYPVFQAHGADGVTLPQRKISIEKTIIIPKDVALMIQEGTELIMAPDVSFMTYGPVTIAGTKEKPVIVRAKEQKKPWGTFAVLGTQEQEVEISYALFSGGKDAVINGTFFSGMVSLYWLKNVQIHHTIFRDAHGDDGLNVKYANVDIGDNFFLQNVGDALDGDFIHGELRGNTFLQNGNDGIDISGSSIRISDTFVEKCGDKGISIGEKSTPTVSTTFIIQCQTGIAIKDASTATIEHVQFIQNKIAVDAFRKKVLFQKGGEGVLLNPTFVENEKNINIDTYASVEMHDEEYEIEERPKRPDLPFVIPYVPSSQLDM